MIKLQKNKNKNKSKAKMLPKNFLGHTIMTLKIKIFLKRLIFLNKIEKIDKNNEEKKNFYFSLKLFCF